ncbi:MAG: hypothetical protein ACYCST_20275 [Acidimicrobiales bacterium]
MNHPNNPSVRDATSLHGFESIEALLRADAERDQPIRDDGFTARVMTRLPIQRAESPWRWALPNLIVVLGVMAILLAGDLMQGFEPHLLTGSVLAHPIEIPWPSLVVAAAVSLAVYCTMDVPWPWDEGPQ